MSTTLKSASIVCTTVGVDGSAVASETITPALHGKLFAVKIDHSAGQAATTDTTISHNGLTLLTIANSATDVTSYPRALVNKSDGSAYTAELVDYFYIGGNVTVSIAQADSAETTTVTIYVIED